MALEAPTGAYFRALLRYEPRTGKLFWKEREDSKSDFFNKNFAGKEALTTVNNHGLRFGMVRSKLYLAHRVIWAMVYDKYPVGLIYHKNGDKLDNRLINLRCAPSSEWHYRGKKNVSHKNGCIQKRL
jgi:hypothetical protein